jgi:X-Pro dipeptidyl-peptidase
VTQPVFSYADAIRETVYVQSTIDADLDGDLDLLATDIVRPKETDAGLEVPVIYEMSPYYQATGRGNESEVKTEEDGDFTPGFFPLFYDNYFVPRGYAVVLQDMRGTRNSEGCMVLGGHEEVVDAEATINWLNGKGKAFDAAGKEITAPWSTGKVGMIGKSYDASIANGAATTGVKGLETIVPIAGISRWYDYHLNNGVQYVNAYTTPALFSFDIDQTPGDDEERGQEWVEATATKNSTCQAVGAQVVAQAADPRADYNAFWDDRDYLKDAKKVQASVFLVHGLNDFNVKPNQFTQWWDALAKAGVPRKIWLSQEGHVDPFDFRRDEWVNSLHRWFDFWLQDVDNGIMDEPMVDLERSPERWVHYPNWPDPRARDVRVFLSAEDGTRPGTLSLTAAPADATQTYADDLDQGEATMVENPDTVSPNRLIYVSQKLKRSVRISGTIRVDLSASVDRADTNFTALLVDYGRAERVDHDGQGEGVQTTPDETCVGESTEADNACYFTTRRMAHANPVEIVSRGWLDARHHESLREATPLTPGEVYDFSWDIFGEDYVFARGHRFAIVIAGSDGDWTVPDTESANVTVVLHDSSASIPVVGGSGQLERAGVIG